MHVGVDGFSGSAHPAHFHDAGTDEHDHEGETDVPIIELGASSAKLIPIFLAFALIALALFVSDQLAFPAPLARRRQGPRIRWRPPLRAPPLPPRHFAQ